jgi:hypothetical protein
MSSSYKLDRTTLAEILYTHSRYSSRHAEYSSIQKFYRICLNFDWNTYVLYTAFTRSLGSAVGIATSYGLDDRGVGVRVPVGSRIFSSPCRPDRL